MVVLPRPRLIFPHAFVALYSLLGCADHAPSPGIGLAGASASTSGGSAGAAVGGMSASGGDTATGGGSAGSAAVAGLAEPPTPAAGTGGQSSGAGGTAAGGAPVNEAGGAPQLGCPPVALTAGVHDEKLEHGGLMRSFRVYVPRGYDNAKAVPLVLSFHGMGSNNTTQETLTQMDAKAETEGFIVVYPLATGSYDPNDLYAWNAGACCGNAVINKVDDVGFARALVGYMEQNACIDPKRVFATGFSNGGRLTYRLGCEAADLFAAIAPVAGIKSFPDLINTPGCKPSRPIPLLDIVGTADPEHLAAQPGQIKEWVSFDACTDAAPMQSYSMNKHVCHTYQQCSVGTSVTYCTVNGAPHTWPIVSGFNTTDQVWALFKRSSL